MIKEFQERNRKVIVSPIRIDLLFVFMQCSILLNLVVFQKIIGMELKRKGYALCFYFLIRKRMKAGKGILEQDSYIRVMWQFQFLILLNAFLPNGHYFLLLILYFLPASFPCSVRHIFLLLLK